MFLSRHYLAPGSATSHRRLSAAPAYAMLFAMQGARSTFIVLMSWFILGTIGSIASVGQVLICGQIVVFVVGPLIGPYLDRFPRRRLFAAGEAIHAGGAGLLAVIACMQLPRQTSLTALCVIACLVSLGSLLSYPSSQALLQQIGSGRLKRTVSVAAVCGQIGNILGSVVAGVSLPHMGVAGSLAICAFASLTAIAFSRAIDEQKFETIEHGCHLDAVVRGIVEITRNPELRVAAFALLLAYASAHASNALLAGFARYDLHLAPQYYGWVAAMYSTGGLIAGFALAGACCRISERSFISIGAVLLTIATAALATSQTLFEALFWQGLIGLSFTLIRVASDVAVLKSAQHTILGRVRSNIEAMIGLVAISIYLAASLTSLGARPLFLALAGLFAFTSLLILLGQYRRSRDVDADQGKGELPTIS